MQCIGSQWACWAELLLTCAAKAQQCRRTQAPGKEDIVWVVKAQPGPEDMEDLGALAEWGTETVLLGLWHRSLHTGLCAIPCKQRYPL